MNNFFVNLNSDIEFSLVIYLYYFLYALIPMSAQIIFSCLIRRKHIYKVILLILCGQPFIIALSNNIAYLIYKISNYSHVISFSNDIIFSILYNVILFSSIFVIEFIVYFTIGKKIDFKMLISLILGYLLNIIITLLMIIKFNMFNVM